jgi:hypothetical protein
MSRTRIAPLVLFFVAQLFVASIASPVHAQEASGVPAYFFSEWTIQKSCAQLNSGAPAHAQAGLKFRVDAASDGAFRLRAIDAAKKRWAGGWRTLKLEYRAGTKMSAIPADFECVPGEEASSPFLAMSGNSQSAEPYYEYEHWYGMATINGESHHVLIFPRPAKGPSSVVIVVQDADSADDVALDHDGTIHGGH